MAKVYLGHAHSASSFCRAVALKVLQEHLRGDATYERMLIEEALWGSKLCHDGLVSVFELGLHEGSYFVCMDYIDGITLADWMSMSRLSHDSAIHVVRRLVEVLDYIHSFRDEEGRKVELLHRDITPSNVILSRTGQVKLLDFGIAKALALKAETQGNLLKGTYSYMSPEQIAGEGLDCRSDIFSLGSLFYELLTGRRAFDRSSIHETMRSVRSCDWSWQDTDMQIPLPYRELVQGCLALDRSERYENAFALHRALMELSCDSSSLHLVREWPAPGRS